jgi:hypothetical protein
LDGRAGLVPSNFVQRVPDSELRELLQQTTATAEPRHNCPAVPSTSAAALVSCCMEPSSLNSSAENHQRTNSARRPESPSFALTVPQHLTRISHDFSDFEQQPKAIVLPDSVSLGTFQLVIDPLHSRYARIPRPMSVVYRSKNFEGQTSSKAGNSPLLLLNFPIFPVRFPLKPPYIFILSYDFSS